jgi:hypothetical protein
MRFACTALLVLAACGDASATFDPCRETGLVVVGRQIAGSSLALDADARGYVLFYGGGPLDQGGEGSSVRAFRPGGPSIQLLSRLDGLDVVAAPVAAGHLVCYAPSSRFPGGGGCLVVDADLRVVEPAREFPVGTVVALGRVHGQLYALAAEDPLGPTSSLVAIDESGRPVAAPVPVACPAGFPERTLLGDGGLACLAASDVSCGTQTEPGGCRFDLSVFATDGAVTLRAQDAAPVGNFSQLITPQLAFSAGHYLVAWTDLSNQAFGRDVPEVGPFAAPRLLFDPVERLFGEPDGFLHVWIGRPPEAPSYGLVRARHLTRTGEPIGDGFFVTPPSGPLHQDVTRHMAFASAGDGLALAWILQYNEKSQPEIVFRSLGCPAR